MVIDGIKQTIEREKLITRGDKILVALSGGPDSVCLLHALKSLESTYGIRIYGAHLNHKIRGIEAQKDAMYAAKLCDKLEIPFFVKAIDVPEFAKIHKLTLEEAARKVRYNMLFEVKSKINADKIAVAHNLDDQAETVLMRLLRGSGIKGLKGMDYFREDGIIRPLMDVEKKDIIKYCENHELNPRIDHTNSEEEYTRNKIRLKLIPFIEKEFSHNIKETLSRTANILREDNAHLEKNAKLIFEKEVIVISKDTVKMDSEELLSCEYSISKRLIRMAIEKISGSLEGIENIHVEDVISLSRNPKNQAMINLPKGIFVYKRPEGIYITTKEMIEKTVTFSHNLEFDDYVEIPEVNMAIESKIMSKEKCMMLPTGQFTKAFDIDKIKGPLTVRARIDGDRMRPMGLGGTKKLKDIFIDLKIPREKRDEVPLVTDKEGILWMVGYKISEDYKIDENTEKVIRITCKPL